MPAKPTKRSKAGRPKLAREHRRSVRVTSLYTPLEIAALEAGRAAEEARLGRPIPAGEWQRELTLKYGVPEANGTPE
jgi:hypothetical protein